MRKRRDICLAAKSIKQALLVGGRRLMGRLCYRTLKDTRADHHRSALSYPSLQGAQEQKKKEMEGKEMREKNDRQKEKPRERQEKFNKSRLKGVALLQLYNWPARTVK